MTNLHICSSQTHSERRLEPHSADALHSRDRLYGRTSEKADPATAEMVHDFRNILGAIHGLADLASLEFLDEPEAAMRMDEIRTACLEGGELCRQMLNRSRNELTPLFSFDLAACVQQMAAQLRVCIPAIFSLELDLAPAPLLAAQRGQLQRIVLNLVKNAAESLGGQPGVVRIHTGMSTAAIGDAASANVPSTGDHSPTSFLVVSDTGRGMDRGRRASLLKGSRARRSGSHGLGFASVRRIVKGCGGAFRISSEPGHGTTVLVTFPHSDSPPEDIVIDARLNMRPVFPG